MKETVVLEKYPECDVTLRTRGRQFILSLYHPGGWHPSSLHKKLYTELRPAWRSWSGGRLQWEDIRVEAEWIEISSSFAVGNPSCLVQLRERMLKLLETEMLPIGDGCRLCGQEPSQIVRCHQLGLSLCPTCAQRSAPPRRLRRWLILAWLILSVALLSRYGTSIEHPWPRKLSKLVLLSGFVVPGILRPAQRRPWLKLTPERRQQQIDRLGILESDQAKVARGRHYAGLGDCQGAAREWGQVLSARPELCDSCRIW